MTRPTSLFDKELNAPIRHDKDDLGRNELPRSTRPVNQAITLKLAGIIDECNRPSRFGHTSGMILEIGRLPQ